MSVSRSHTLSSRTYVRNNDKRREIDLPVSFAVAKKSEEALLYKKGQSRRRRAITGREAADQAETVERNRRHAQSLEQLRSISRL